MSEFEKMTDGELNEAIARTVMGWKRGDRTQGEAGVTNEHTRRRFNFR